MCVSTSVLIRSFSFFLLFLLLGILPPSESIQTDFVKMAEICGRKKEK